MAVTYYPAVIDRSDSGFGVSFPDIPGCTSAGASIQEAAVNAEAALALHLDSMRKDGDTIPEPSGLDAVDVDPEIEVAALVLIRATTEAKFQRVQITLEDGLLSAIDAVSPNRSAFLAEAARVALRTRTGNAAGGKVVRRSKKAA